MSIYKITFAPFSAEEVENVNGISWQWVPDDHAYVEMMSEPTDLDDVAENAEFLCNEDAFYEAFTAYCVAEGEVI